ncbi:MAG TPA: hypothetical protein VHC47_11820 [Mucilaginibacter sp.]|nr:hypothetical protein [Mucilaginibacter sp.]
MTYLTLLTKKYVQALTFALIFFSATRSAAQKSAAWQLDKMPVKLETDFALSALPPYLRANATVYLLDPNKGYYVGRMGSNGFICFVSRTEWEWGEFRQDIATPISFDAEGARTIFPMYEDVAAMRASGKYTAPQIKSIMTDRVKKGTYKTPVRQGISFMLGPIMRSYYGPTSDYRDVVTMSMPHYMFYARNLTNADIGNKPDGSENGPFVVNAAAPFLGAKNSPFGYIIVPVGATEKAKIMKDSQDLLKRLIAYRSYLKPGTGMRQ